MLKPYTSWVDFAGHLKNEASIINFIAAYGTHALITGQTTIEGKRDAALTLITGVSVGGLAVQGDAVDFLNGTGAYSGSLGGLNDVDLWIGGLAEEIMPFGGMLGSTFNFVFEMQMEKLQSGDRFYYLQRLDGLHLFGEMENNSFAAMIMRNTDATHLPSDVFSTPGLILEVDQTKQFNDLDGNGTLESDDPVGSGILTNLVIRDNPATGGADTNYLRYTGGEHVVLGGTAGNDIMIAGIGDDTLFGDAGNDTLEGGFGNDIINGGDGDDIIKDSGGDDNIKAGSGNDVVHAGPGLDLVMGGAGQDFIFLGTDMGSEVFAGEGNDFIYGNKNAERILGNEGDDWIETGTFDGAPGDNFDEIYAHDAVNGHDVFLGDGGFDEFIAEGGDDIMVGSPGRGKMAGMSGWDWATYEDNVFGVDADLTRAIVFDENPNPPINGTLDAYEAVEGLSGSDFDDRLTGSDMLAADRAPFSTDPALTGSEGYRGSALNAEGIARIAGLQAVLGAGVTSYINGDILLGGDGSDIITGRAGDDIIDGDKSLNVRISVRANIDGTGAEIGSHETMTTLANQMFSGAINPGQLQIVREIIATGDASDIDVAVFADIQENYTITANPDGSISVAHTTVTDGLESDGIDRVRNIEILRFADGDLVLGAPSLMLNTSVANSYVELFDTASYTAADTTGTTPWTTIWDETNDGATDSPTGGDIEINGGRLRFDENIGGGETIQRAVNLAGATSATLRFDYEDDSLDAASPGNPVENVVVEAWNGTAWNVIGTLGGSTASGDGTFVQALTPAQISASSAIRFRAEGDWEGGENFYIDNIRIDYVQPVPTPTVNYETTFTEGAAAVAIASGPSITDNDDTQMASARIVLTNAQLDDAFVIGTLPAGISSSIDLSVSGQIIVNLTGAASLAAYQAAIQAISFTNTSASPTTIDRIVTVTVNDGLLNSAPATTTINVVAVNDPPVANTDNVITNAVNEAFVVPEWVMLANDEDPEGGVLNVTGATENDGSFSIVNGATGDVTATSTNTSNHDFTYTVSDGTATDTADVDIVWDTAGELTGNAGANIIIGNAAGSTINGLGGDDIILAGGGNDTINQTGSNGGRDFVDGGAAVDTYQLNGAAGAETFVIYSRAAAETAFTGIVLNSLTEIVITRNGTVIAELNDIEEIRVNTLLVTSPPGTGGSNSGDTIQVVGDFIGTSLNFNTITIDGNAGDDTIDISSLDSAHRIVFRSNGGHDTIIGTLRPQDVVELPDGAALDDYDVSDEGGVVTMTSPTHSVTFTTEGGAMPHIVEYGDDDDDDDDDDDNHGGGDCDNDEDDDDDDGGNHHTGSGPVIGTPQDDVLMGTSGGDLVFGFAGTDYIVAGAGADIVRSGAGGDFVDGGEGRDVIFGDADDDDLFGGDDDDMIYGDDGNDRVFGDDGNDLLDAGAGNDSVFGGNGNDVFVGSLNDGNDSYHGGDISADSGNDTLDLGFLTAAVAVNLGTGVGGRGSAVSTQSGTDALWGIENVTTGSGDDRITMSSAVNVVDGGQGEDVFIFGSAGEAHGDTIRGFEAGDKIDLSGIDANTGVAGNSAFTLESGQATTAPGQIVVTHETRMDGEYTVVSGNTSGNDNAPEFRISISGNHALTNADFNL